MKTISRKSLSLILLLTLCLSIMQPALTESAISTDDYLMIPTYDVFLKKFGTALSPEYQDVYNSLYEFGGLENGGWLSGVNYREGLLGSEFEYSLHGDVSNKYIKKIRISVSGKTYPENKNLFMSCILASIEANLIETDKTAIKQIQETILKGISFDEIIETSFNTAKQTYIYGAYEYTFKKDDGYELTMTSIFD